MTAATSEAGTAYISVVSEFDLQLLIVSLVSSNFAWYILS